MGAVLKDDEFILKEFHNAKNQIQIIKDSLIKLKIQEADLSNSEALKNYKQYLSVTNLESDFITLQTAVNNIIENIIIDSFTDKNNVDIYEVTIQYKGLSETSTFLSILPYNKWIYAHNTKEATTDEKLKLSKEEIEAFEFAYDTKVKDGEYPYDEKPDVIETSYAQLENITLKKKDVVKFNKVTEKRKYKY